MKNKRKNIKPWVKNTLVGILIALVAFSAVGALFVMETSAADVSAPLASVDDLDYFLPIEKAKVWSNQLGSYRDPIFSNNEGFDYVTAPSDTMRSAVHFGYNEGKLSQYLLLKYRMPHTSGSYLKLIVHLRDERVSFTVSAVSYGFTNYTWRAVLIDLSSIVPSYIGFSDGLKFEFQFDSDLDIAFMALDDDLDTLCGLLADNEGYWTCNNGLLSANVPSVPHGLPTSCDHSYDDDGKCTLCGFACLHKPLDHVYRNASATHHEVMCGVCGYGLGLFEHSATSNGNCVCGYALSCDHRFSYSHDDTFGGHSGVCSVCGYTTSLSACSFSADGVCSVCGYRCPSHKLNSSGYCYDCHYQCPHSDVLISSLGAEGHAIFCNTCQNLLPDSTHTYVDCKCTVCGYECEHVLVDGSCGICGFICSHPDGSIISFDEKGHLFRCSVCQDTDLFHPHDLTPSLSSNRYTSHFCVVCGYESAHTWVLDGKACVCTGCNIPCVHTDFTIVGTSSNTHRILCSICGGTADITHIFNGLTTPCDVCGYRCTHEWKESVCVLCNYPCPHVYVGGTCSICKYRCLNHEYDDRGVCSVCGGIKQVATEGFEVGFVNLFSAIYDAQANTFFSLLGYEIMGINIANLIIAVVGLGIIAFALKKVM